jgi:hypothetical protein
MKKMLLVVAYLFATLVITAQTVNFRNISLDEACSIAKKENKIVMLVLESPTCNQCNEVAIQGLTGSVVKRNIDNSCVVLKQNKIPAELTNINNLFQMNNFSFGVVYLDDEKNILSVQTGSTTNYSIYLDQIEKAMNEKDNQENNIAKLQRDFYNNVAGFTGIKRLVEKIKAMKLEPAQVLLDDLVLKAPKDSAESISFVQFLLECAPIINSFTLKYAYKNADNYNVAWYRMPLVMRQSINGRITQKSITKAIMDKDQNYAYEVANSSRVQAQSRGNNYMQQMYQSTMLKYYKGVKDSMTYIRMAIPYYTQYLMSVSIDSITKIDSSLRLQLQTMHLPNSNEKDKNLRESIENGKVQSNATTTIKRLIAPSANLSPQKQNHCNALNEAAWTIYTFTKDINLLNKALIFAKRANEFFESPEAMDTYARLLYKTDHKLEAINWETKAIASAKLRSISNNSEYEKVLAKMQANETKIDEY